MAWPLMLWVSLIWPFTFYSDPGQHTVVYLVDVKVRKFPDLCKIFYMLNVKQVIVCQIQQMGILVCKSSTDGV